MSYILEALRRSQAERERGRVPGLDAHPAPAEPRGAVSPRLPPAWIAGGLLLLTAVLAAAFWAAQRPRAEAVLADAAPPAPLPAAPPTPAPPAVLPQVVSAPPPVVAAAPLPVTEPPATRAAPLTPVPEPPTPRAAPPAPPAPPRPLALAELSPEQRRELPNMVIGGSIWSDSAVSRFVIVNGQIVREGEAAAPGVTLERIGPKAATLRWRELRIDVPL